MQVGGPILFARIASYEFLTPATPNLGGHMNPPKKQSVDSISLVDLSGGAVCSFAADANGTILIPPGNYRIFDADLKYFTVTSFEPPKTGSIRDALSRIHQAGGKAWDGIDDPDAKIAEMRGT